MKLLFFWIVFIVGHQVAAGDFFERADAFFGLYVEDGLVRYEAIRKDPAQLNALVEQIAVYPLKQVSATEQKAFLINAYNLLVIHQVIANYPTAGPLKIDGFFDKQQFKVAGTSVTLNALEKDMLMEPFPDARLHFVLVCAAMGCPQLAGFAYRPEVLEKQLMDRTAYILNFENFIRVNNEKVVLSKIFEWYSADFLKDARSIPAYIDQFRKEKINGKDWSYYEYDWSLNKK